MIFLCLQDSDSWPRINLLLVTSALSLPFISNLPFLFWCIPSSSLPFPLKLPHISPPNLFPSLPYPCPHSPFVDPFFSSHPHTSFFFSPCTLSLCPWQPDTLIHLLLQSNHHCHQPAPNTSPHSLQTFNTPPVDNKLEAAALAPSPASPLTEDWYKMEGSLLQQDLNANSTSSWIKP